MVWLLWDPHSFPTWAGCFACAPCWSAYPRLRSQYGCGLDVSFFQHARDCCMDVANLGDTGIDQDMTSLRCNLQDPVKVKVGLSLRSKTTWCLGILQEFLLHKFRICLPSLCWFKYSIFSILCKCICNGSLLPWPRKALISSSTKSWCSQGPIPSSPIITYSR